jgi:hypothetical protein
MHDDERLRMAFRASNLTSMRGMIRLFWCKA